DDGILNDPALLRQYLTFIQGQGRDLVRIAAELLAFTDVTAERAGGPPQEPAARLAPLLEELARGRPLRIVADAEAATAAVSPDRTRLILAQLLDHAYTFSSPGAPVTTQVELQPNPKRLMVWVRCRGAALSAATLSALFDP